VGEKAKGGLSFVAVQKKRRERSFFAARRALFSATAISFDPRCGTRGGGEGGGGRSFWSRVRRESVAIDSSVEGKI